MQGGSRWVAVALLAPWFMQRGHTQPPLTPFKLRLPADPKPGQVFTSPFDGTELVFIPGGECMMGSDDTRFDEDGPAHKVEVAGFWLGKYEVTNEQYRSFIEATGHREPRVSKRIDGERKWKEVSPWDDEDFNHPKQPVVGVSWHHAVAYCKWAGCRLPTEAEWEYAARGGKQHGYGTASGELSRDSANTTGWFRSPVTAELLTLAPVGSYPANPFGLHDMAGNVMEYTSSLWRDYPYNAEDGREDPDDKDPRVARGGSYMSSPSVWCRCAARFRIWRRSVCSFVGFRLCVSPSAQTAVRE